MVEVDWVTCISEDCIGVRIEHSDQCLRHCDKETRRTFLEQVRAARSISLMGVQIDRSIWSSIMDAAHRDRPAGGQSRPIEQIDLRLSTVEVRFELNSLTIQELNLAGATFKGAFDCQNCSIGGFAAQDTSFMGPVFVRATVFKYDFRLKGLTIPSHTSMSFVVAGPLSESGPPDEWEFGDIRMDDVLFGQDVSIRFAARTAIIASSRVPEGPLRLLGAFAAIDLKKSVFEGATVLMSSPDPYADLEGRALANRGFAVLSEDGEGAEVALTSLEETDAANLTLVDVDVGGCRFAGGVNLHQLRTEGSVKYCVAQGTGYRPLRPSKRHAIMDEVRWRTERRPWPFERAWKATFELCRKQELLAPTHTIASPERIEAAYRDLRVAKQAAGDMPGSSEFYYGEMEMRRLSGRDPWPVRTQLFLYWLLSGYGTRPGRAAAAWVLLGLVGFLLLNKWGWLVPSEEGWLESFGVTVDALVFRSVADGLSVCGEWVVRALRVAGPILLGLFVLALRGRVRQ